MASQQQVNDSLLKAALDGFSSLERRTKRPDNRLCSISNLKPSNNYPGNEASVAINSKEAARRYGGLVIEPVITSEKAAKRYGGIVIGPPITSDEAVQRYGGVQIADTPKQNAYGA